MESQGVKRVIFWGVSDEMEIAYVTLQGTDLKLVAIVDDDDGVNGKIILGQKVREPNAIDSLKADAILITSILDKERILQKLKKTNNRVEIFAIN
jgi:hypothetical protein